MKIIEKDYEIRCMDVNIQFRTKKFALKFFNNFIQALKNQYGVKIIHIEKNNYCIYESNNIRYSIEFISYK